MTETRQEQDTQISPVRADDAAADTPQADAPRSLSDIVRLTIGSTVILCIAMTVEGGLISGFLGRSDLDDQRFLDAWALPMFLVAVAASFVFVRFGALIFTKAIAALVSLLGGQIMSWLLGTPNRRLAILIFIVLGIGLAILSLPYWASSLAIPLT